MSADHPTWEWNAAPGSPWTLRVQPRLLPDPTPGLERSVGGPFSMGPSCTRLELDERGLPVRTLPRRASDPLEDAYAWTYDARGRVVEERVDEVPFCPINDYGTEGPCGVPDGTWDRITTYRWRDLPSGGAIVTVDAGWEREFDARGRLVRSTRPDVEHAYRGDQLVTTRTDELTSTFTYDAAGRLVQRQITKPGGSSTSTTVWEYDAMGNLTSVGSSAGGLNYANTYLDGRLVSVRTTSRGSVQMSPPVAETVREHDARGLVVRLVASVTADQRWIRDERGVPIARSGVGPDEDYRCLARLADRVLASPGG